MAVLVSVIIPAYNEEEDIGKCLSSLEKQSYKNKEVIVIDDGSIDKTKEIIWGFKKVKLIKGEHRGPGFSRNLGAKKARGKILIFVDADMTFEKNYIKNLIEPIIKEKIIGTEEGRQIASNQENIWSKCWGTHFKDYSYQDKGYIFRAIQKKEFFKMGCFDPKYGYGDDATFYFKYGIMSRRVKNAVCYHKNPETLKEVFKQSRWIGASIQNKVIEIKGINYLVPLFGILLSPIMIVALSIKKCHKNGNFSLFLPMLLFMTYRYFGTLNGLFRKIYFGMNVR
ncbi:glycosyltransferase family 2 protein [Candidatus Pacearchaeota archaeon]|nr:glycosyltransferase family 2 protein [Candidatus Pacearchaeota archaeon]